MESKKYLFPVLRAIIGSVFILSAMAKFYSLADFEIYIYSLNIFSLEHAYVLARLVVGFELALGALLLTGIYFKRVKKITSITLLAFTAGLLFIHLKTDNENCQCFGDLIHMTPLQAITKNLILLGVLMVTRSSNRVFWLQKAIVFWVICIMAVGIPFLMNPPDHWSQKIYERETKIGLAPLNNFLKNPANAASSFASKKLIAFYGSKCRFCKQAAKRVSEIVKKHNIKQSQILNIFWGKAQGVEEFYEETSSLAFNHQLMDTETFFAITKGQMPLIVLVENNELIFHYQLTTINEGEIAHFFED